MKFGISSFLFITALLAPLMAQEPTKVVSASPQSVEFFLPDDEGAKVRCTVRLHLSPSEGYSIRQMLPLERIAATDGAGNAMQGTFREWEHCYDSDDGRRCLIAVYDFPTCPCGGSMSFDTSVEVPLSCGVLSHAPVTFSLAESSRITVNGHSFTITPSEANATDPDNTAFLLEYENSPDIAGISIGNEAGEIMEVNIIEGVYMEEGNRVSATYAISSKHDKLQFRLSTHKPQGVAVVPVKFRATIGR